MRSRQWVVAAVVALVVVPGLIGTASASAGIAPGQLPDPEEDVIGWEDGYWHNESIDIDQNDGLSAAELEAYVARAMARVEYLREREFVKRVPVTVERRSVYVNRTRNASSNATYNAWNNQVWEALFIVGEDADIHEELGSVTGAATSGYYSISENQIKIVTESPGEPTIDNATLIHELVHALQDQHFNLSRPAYRGHTQDTQLAIDGLIEGEANLIEHRYAERCGVEWSCVSSPTPAGSGGPPAFNLGVFLTLFHPYSDGPAYIDSVQVRGGWRAVDTLHDDPPDTTEHLIHGSGEPVIPLAFEDRARGGWERFTEQGVNGSDTAGEGSIYSMFWYQARAYGAQTVRVQGVLDTTGPLDTYNYDAESSAGWQNDRIVPYHNESGEETRFGYVWVTTWEREADAREFRAAYRAILTAHEAERIDDRTWVIPAGPYADAFRVVRSGNRVVIVNGPSVDALDELRPGLSLQGQAVDLVPGMVTAKEDQMAHFDVVVSNAETGLGAWSFTVNVDDPSVATITSVDLAVTDPTGIEPSISSDNSSVSFDHMGVELNSSGRVTIATVTLSTHRTGETPVNLSFERLTNRSGEPYQLRDVSGASLSVTDRMTTATAGQAGFGGVVVILALLGLMFFLRYRT